MKEQEKNETENKEKHTLDFRFRMGLDSKWLSNELAALLRQLLFCKNKLRRKAKRAYPKEHYKVSIFNITNQLKFAKENVYGSF